MDPATPTRFSVAYEWRRASAYEWQPDRDPVIAPRSGATRESYRPFMSNRRLFEALADTELTQAGVLGFVQQFGLLREGEGTRRFSWYRRVIAGMRQHVELWRACQSGSDEAVREYARELHTRQRRETKPLTSHVPGLDQVCSRRDGLVLLSRMLGVHATPFFLALAHEPPHDRPVLEVRPNELMDAVWLQFACAIVAASHYRRCEHCGQFFDLTTRRSDTQYCRTSHRVMASRKRKAALQRIATEGQTGGAKAPQVQSRSTKNARHSRSRNSGR